MAKLRPCKACASHQVARGAFMCPTCGQLYPGVHLFRVWLIAFAIIVIGAILIAYLTSAKSPKLEGAAVAPSKTAAREAPASGEADEPDYAGWTPPEREAARSVVCADIACETNIAEVPNDQVERWDSYCISRKKDELAALQTELHLPDAQIFNLVSFVRARVMEGKRGDLHCTAEELQPPPPPG
jgi:hypothetical protein